MAKQYRIDIILGVAEMEAASRQAVASLLGIEKASGRVGQAAAKAATAEQKALERTMVGLDKLRMSAVKFADQRAAAAEKAAAKTAAAEQKAIQSTMVGLDKLRMSGLDLQSKLSAAAAARAAKEERLTAKSLSDEQVAAAVKNKLITDSNRKRVESAMKTATGEGKALDQVRTAAGSTAQALIGISAGAAAISMVAAAGAKLVGILEEANDKAKEQVDKLLETKDLIREIVMIQGGKEGPSDAEVNRFMAIRKESGLSANEAKEFSLEFEGASAAYRDVNIPAAEYDRLKPMLAKFAASAGGGADAAGTYGKLGGLIIGLNKFEKAEDVLAKETQFNRILSRGVGDNPTLIKQQAQIAGAFLSDEGQGIVKDSNELAAITATASRISPTRSAEIMKSGARVLRGFDEKWAPMLKQAGITEKDTYAPAANKLFAKLEQVEKSGRSGDVWLQEQGVEQRGAMHFMSMYRNREFLNKAIRDEATPMTGAEATAELEHKFRADTSLRIKQQQAAFEESKLANAMPLQFAKELELEAKTRLERRGEGEDMAAARTEDWKRGWAANPNPFAGMDHEEFGRKIRVEQEMFRIAKERGLSVPGRPDDTSLLGGYTFDYTNWLMSGEDLNAYSSVGFEKEQRGKVVAPRPMGMDRPGGAPPPILPTMGDMRFPGGHQGGHIDVGAGPLRDAMDQHREALDANTKALRDAQKQQGNQRPLPRPAPMIGPRRGGPERAP